MIFSGKIYSIMCVHARICVHVCVVSVHALCAVLVYMYYILEILTISSCGKDNNTSTYAIVNTINTL